MPLSSAEKSKRYREKLKNNNPAKYLSVKKRNVERALKSYRAKMPPRQDIVAQPQVIRVEQVRPPPPPAPGRFQRPPHDHPMPYVRPPRATNVVNTR